MNHDPYHDGGNRADFVGELGEAIRQNPVPAALVGAGFLWLLMGGREVLLGGASHSLLSGAGEGAKRSSRAAYRGARYAGSAGLGRCQSNGGRRCPTRLSAFRIGVSNAAEAVSSAAGNLAEQVTHAASETAGRVRSSREDAELDDSYRNPEFSVAKRMQNSLADLFAQQPLLLGAVGIAIGAGIAASMPRSEAEDRLMGSTADAAKSRGEALWQEAKKRGTDLASRGLDEAEARDLTPEAAADVARAIGSKVAGIAEKASKDIADRIKG